VPELLALTPLPGVPGGFPPGAPSIYYNFDRYLDQPKSYFGPVRELSVFLLDENKRKPTK
jgi:hypothetical protein